MATPLSTDERQNLLPALHASGWAEALDRDAIVKTFVFSNFIDAFGFMARAAIWAEKWNHHPEWSNIYKTVVVTLITHDANGLTALDIKLATKLDKLAGHTI